MEPNRQHMLIVGGIIAFVVIVFIVIHNLTSGSSQTITPANPSPNNAQQTASDLQSLLSQFESSNQSGNTGLANTLTAAISGLQTQIQSMPAGATQDQMNSALATLTSNIQDAITTGNTNSITSINQTLAGMQSALNQSGTTNTSQITNAISNLQTLLQNNANSLTSINANVNSLSSWLQTQLTIVQGLIKANAAKFVPFTEHDIHDLGWLEGGLGFGLPGTNSQQKISDFVQAFRDQFPQYNNLISGTTLTDIGYSVFDTGGSMYGKITSAQQFADYLNKQFDNLPKG